MEVKGAIRLHNENTTLGIPGTHQYEEAHENEIYKVITRSSEPW